MESPPAPRDALEGILRGVARAATAGAPPALPAPERERAVADAARFARAEIALMAPHLRLAAAAGLLAFDLAAIPAAGRRFRALAESQGRARLAAWDASPIGFVRDFAKLIRSLALLGYYDHPVVANALGAGAAPPEGPTPEEATAE